MKSHLMILLGIFFITSAYSKSALIIVDMQNCFVSGSDKSVHSLPVNGGRDLVEKINKIQKRFDLVVATKDWHPANHISFASNHPTGKVFGNIKLKDGSHQALWPDHCVKNTLGSNFIKGLDTTKVSKIVYKGEDTNTDSYSGFMNNNKSDMTPMHDYLKAEKVSEVYVVGLAADYCVKFTAIDGANLGYKTYFIKDLTKAVDPSILPSLYKELKSNKVKVINSKEI